MTINDSVTFFCVLTDHVVQCMSGLRLQSNVFSDKQYMLLAFCGQKKEDKHFLIKLCIFPLSLTKRLLYHQSHNELRILCLVFSSVHSCSSVRHPQSNGLLERFHSILLEMMRIQKAEYPNEHPLNVVPLAVITYINSANKTHRFNPSN